MSKSSSPLPGGTRPIPLPPPHPSSRPASQLPLGAQRILDRFYNSKCDNLQSAIYLFDTSGRDSETPRVPANYNVPVSIDFPTICRSLIPHPHSQPQNAVETICKIVRRVLRELADRTRLHGKEPSEWQKKFVDANVKKMGVYAVPDYVEEVDFFIRLDVKGESELVLQLPPHRCQVEEGDDGEKKIRLDVTKLVDEMFALRPRGSDTPVGEEMSTSGTDSWCMTPRDSLADSEWTTLFGAGSMNIENRVPGEVARLSESSTERNVLSERLSSISQTKQPIDSPAAKLFEYNPPFILIIRIKEPDGSIVIEGSHAGTVDIMENYFKPKDQKNEIISRRPVTVEGAGRTLVIRGKEGTGPRNQGELGIPLLLSFVESICGYHMVLSLSRESCYHFRRDEKF